MSHSHSQESAPGLFLKDCRLQKKLHSQDWLSRNFGKAPGRFGGERTVFSRWCWATGQPHATEGRRTLTTHAHARAREVHPRPPRRS